MPARQSDRGQKPPPPVEVTFIFYLNQVGLLAPAPCDGVVPRMLALNTVWPASSSVILRATP